MVPVKNENRVARLVRLVREKARDLYAREPARVNAVAAAGITAAALAVGVVLDAPTAALLAGAVISLVLTGEGTRSQVTPPANAAELAAADPVTDTDNSSAHDSGLYV